MTLDDDLVTEVLDRVKALREHQIGAQQAGVEAYYVNYHRLGVGEAALVELALEVAAKARPAARQSPDV